MFNGGPGINHILLEQSSTTKDVVGVKVVWTWVKAVGIVQQLGDIFCTSTLTFIEIHRDGNIPTVLASRMYKNVVKSCICMAELTDALKSTTLKPHDKITFF